MKQLVAERIAVIGDIHGEAGLLTVLLEALPDDRPLVTVGDVGDRGPDTAGVLDLLVDRGAVGALGNHDLWLRAWTRGEGFDPFALHPAMGGEATLRSYGVLSGSPPEIEAQRFSVPRTHRRWLDELPWVLDLQVAGAPYWVAHTGLPAYHPAVALPVEERVPWLAQGGLAEAVWAKVDPAALLPLDRPLIMGHMAQQRPLDLGAVLALDSGSGYPDGLLSALLLPERRFVTVGP